MYDYRGIAPSAVEDHLIPGATADICRDVLLRLGVRHDLRTCPGCGCLLFPQEADCPVCVASRCPTCDRLYLGDECPDADHHPEECLACGSLVPPDRPCPTCTGTPVQVIDGITWRRIGRTWKAARGATP